MKQLPEIKKIIHSGDYTHIIWADDSKTSVKKKRKICPMMLTVLFGTGCS